ncbi:hypothetical protein BX661DRAFT_186918 [Kickxella alabastrina]|uniref:uncharacterized protein n=1 Tax=Kickxella alabastrina TaxID=61397 RepID=UPI00221F71D5|nr:uncharacterized protein BX661DRAFT_186918 [Kickxella alabastrina]KAI7823136.1 hypothetical protein BX661DRAFT_186918 [Kickxella alabastrina]
MDLPANRHHIIERELRKHVLQIFLQITHCTIFVETYLFRGLISYVTNKIPNTPRISGNLGIPSIHDSPGDPGIRGIRGTLSTRLVLAT